MTHREIAYEVLNNCVDWLYMDQIPVSLKMTPLSPKMTNLLIGAVILIAILISVSIISPRFNLETFEGSLMSLDDLKWGLLDWNDQSLIRNHQIRLFRLPLPLEKFKPPPKNTSPETDRELEMTQELSTNLTEGQVESIARYEKSVMDEFLTYCQDHHLLYDHAYLQHVATDVRCLCYQLKSYFNRPRPYQLGLYRHRLIYSQPVTNSASPSYPSYRTLLAKVLAYIISYNNPSHTNHLHNIAKQIELSRLLGGYNYVSDNQASLEIAMILKTAIRYWENNQNWKL